MNYLNPGGYGVHRSNSERRRGNISVEQPRRGRSQSFTRKVYYDDDGYSAYSGSSYGSREPSRSRSRSRHAVTHHRSPSFGSEYNSEDGYGEYEITRRVAQRPSPHEEELARQLEAVQLQLEKVQEGEKKRQMEEEQRRLERLRNEEIERKVDEQIARRKREDEEKARAEAAAMEAERQKIEKAARELLEEQARMAAAAKAAEAAEAAKIAAIVEDTKKKILSAQEGKKTFTRFSKIHLCREALDERKIPYTEDVSVGILKCRK